MKFVAGGTLAQLKQYMAGLLPKRNCDYGHEKAGETPLVHMYNRSTSTNTEMIVATREFGTSLTALRVKGLVVGRELVGKGRGADPEASVASAGVVWRLNCG